jgi:hypothetical protein
LVRCGQWVLLLQCDMLIIASSASNTKYKPFDCDWNLKEADVLTKTVFKELAKEYLKRHEKVRRASESLTHQQLLVVLTFWLLLRRYLMYRRKSTSSLKLVKLTSNHFLFSVHQNYDLLLWPLMTQAPALSTGLRIPMW